MLRGETADLTRGCTGITNEELYKCMSHEIGQQVGISILQLMASDVRHHHCHNFHQCCHFSISLLVTATEMNVTPTGKQRETLTKTILKYILDFASHQREILLTQNT